MDWAEADERFVFQRRLEDVVRANEAIYGIEDEGRFLAFIEENMRPQPEEYAKIRQINAGLLTVDADQQDIMDLGKNECAASAMQARQG
jgi:hypothetical protein